MISHKNYNNLKIWPEDKFYLNRPISLEKTGDIFKTLTELMIPQPNSI